MGPHQTQKLQRKLSAKWKDHVLNEEGIFNEGLISEL